MSKKEIAQMNAQDALQSIQEHLQLYASVSEMWKTVAKAGAALAFAMRRLNPDELSDISDLIDQVVCLLEVLEPIEKGGQA